ncbi:hypothetical protein Tco_1007642 [Tanacetum coccineum]
MPYPLQTLDVERQVDSHLRQQYLEHGDLGEYGQDFYGYGRTVLRCVIQHKFEDDDARYDLDFENDVMFTNELDALKKVDGVAHDLVAKLLNWKLYGYVISFHNKLCS